MEFTEDTHLRIARPTRDLRAAERFWVEGLGLSVLWRTEGEQAGDHALLMAGIPGGGWHLELVGASGLEPAPTEEDLLVVYLEGPVPDELVGRLESCGGRRVPARNPYWDRWGVTVEDPDGYRLVLSTRRWHNEENAHLG
jgi:catechol 2,3-dioxygenase-like lactoylglutathione lyase family enzyme